MRTDVQARVVGPSHAGAIDLGDPKVAIPAARPDIAGLAIAAIVASSSDEGVSVRVENNRGTAGGRPRPVHSEAIKVEEASDAGQKSMEHLQGVALGVSSEEEALFATKYVQTGDFIRRDLRGETTYDESKAAALFTRFIKNGTWQCPTLVVNRSYQHLDDGIFVHSSISP